MSAADSMKHEIAACINCGFCESVCPTFQASGARASYGARGRVILAGEILKGNLEGCSDPFFSCLDCFACAEVCPAGVNAGIVSGFAKRMLSSQGMAPPLAMAMERMIVRYNSVLPAGRRMGRWARDLHLPSDGETLLYTGQMYQLMSYSGRISSIMSRYRKTAHLLSSFQKYLPQASYLLLLLNDRKQQCRMIAALRSIVLLLKSAGIDFAYADDEPYPGTLLNDYGFEESFRLYARRTVEFFRKHGARRIVTVDPHTYDLIRNVYPKYVQDFDFEIVHYLELVDNLKIRRLAEEVTVHEPCHLVRRHRDPALLRRLVEKVAIPAYPLKNGRNTMCCGGPDEFLYSEIGHHVLEKREGQLAETGSGRIVTACPVCLWRMGNVNAEDIGQLLYRQSES